MGDPSTEDTMKTMRVVDTDGPGAEVVEVAPVEPITVERVAWHPGVGARARACAVWVVRDGAGRKLGESYYRRGAHAIRRAALACAEANRP